ncbi:hypothetical protein QUA43_20565 [Microcoleus sp. N9_B4]|uniref:hypothetical protein n=1 Tax=Microcoleus sp. N9_B4 TaxID=3055386 RepID=UPI002FD0B7D2
MKATKLEIEVLRQETGGSLPPLSHHNLLYLVSDPNQPKPAFLAHNLLLDEQITRFLLGEKRPNRK